MYVLTNISPLVRGSRREENNSIYTYGFIELFNLVNELLIGK